MTRQQNRAAMRIASVNMYVGLNREQAAEGLDAVLYPVVGPAVDIVALQEWPHRRNRILRRLGRLHRGATVLRRRLRRKGAPATGYTFARPLRHGGPVGVRAARLVLLACNARLLTGACRVDKVPGRRRWLPASYATEVLAYDEQARQEVAILGYHLTAGIQDGEGDYRRDRPLAVARHRREVAALYAHATRHLAAGRRVIAIGDGNYDGLTIPGLVSCWRGHPGIGTLGNRAVDCIHTTRLADDVDVIRSDSDHRHPIATYAE